MRQFQKMQRNGNCVMVCGFLKATRFLRNQIFLQTQGTLFNRYVLLDDHLFLFFQFLFMNFWNTHFKIKVGRGKRKERKRTQQNLPKRQKLPNVRKALYSILVLTFLYLTNHNARTNSNEPIGSRIEYMQPTISAGKRR